jgi:hypothetical protein
VSESFARSLYHVCSPTLRRVKPSNLFTVHKQRCPDWHTDLQECRSTLERFGFGLTVLEENLRYLVVMVYHGDSLRRCLGKREPMRWLNSLGYSNTLSLEGKLEHLEQRFGKDSCPHEIGLFLGYPLEDVRGFIANKGKNSKYTGEWKVYGDLPRALRLFQSYRDSRSWVMEQAKRGMGLEEILKAC